MSNASTATARCSAVSRSSPAALIFAPVSKSNLPPLAWVAPDAACGLGPSAPAEFSL